MFTFFPFFQLCQQDIVKCYLDGWLWLRSGLYGLSDSKRPSKLPGKCFIAFSKLLTIPRSYWLSHTSHGQQDLSWLLHWRILKTVRPQGETRHTAVFPFFRSDLEDIDLLFSALGVLQMTCSYHHQCHLYQYHHCKHYLHHHKHLYFFASKKK